VAALPQDGLKVGCVKLFDQRVHDGSDRNAPGSGAADALQIAAGAVRRVGLTALLSPALTARGEHQIRLGGVEPSPGLRTMRRRIDSFAIGNARTNLRGLSAFWFD
jgi:hypothetical protein